MCGQAADHKSNDCADESGYSLLDRMRHSSAHVLAQAVQRLYPGVKFGIGPVIEHGFYYDFELEHRFTEEDLPKIEDMMRQIIKENYAFEKEYSPRAEALNFFRERGQPFKCEIIESVTDEKVSLVKDGDFIDLCKYPHVASTGEIKAIKLLTLAGAYWRGNEQNPMLQRIYGTAFEDEKALRQHLHNLEEAKKRDHRVLGKELDLFSFHEESPGMAFFHHKGFFVYNALIEYIRSQIRRRDYFEVQAPALLTDELWKRSGHFDNFNQAMYFTVKDERQYAIKPMNCPGHALMYKAKQHSYRELPIRIAEFGKVCRYEKSGVTHGLFRVRSFTQDDAHHFCTENQLQSEIKDLIELTREVYGVFGFERYQVAISTRPAQAMGAQELWDKATQALESALKSLDMPYTIKEGEGAFYGPKIEFVIFDSLNRPWQCGTIQVDFSMPERFDLEYVDSDGTRKRPVMVHRAILGSIERFLGILIEHYGGAFPLWLAPVQVRVMTISEKQDAFAEQVHARFLDAGLRSEIDKRSEKIGYKIREAEKQKIPYIAVIGDREVENGNLALRARGREDLGTMTAEDLMARIEQQVKNKK